MKQFLLFFAVSLLFLETSFADWVVRYKATFEGQGQEMNIMQIKGDKVRMDIGEVEKGQGLSVVTNGVSGSVVTLIHHSKSMFKTDEESRKGMMARDGGAMRESMPAVKIVATGQKEKVGTYDCEVYTWSSQGGSGKFWFAEDFPGYQQINAAMEKVHRYDVPHNFALYPQPSDFPGMLIKSEMTMMGISGVTELVLAKEATVNESTFALPEDYQEVETRVMPGK